MKKVTKTVRPDTATVNTNKKGENGKAAAVTPAPRELTAEQKEKLQALSERILGNLTRNYETGKALIEVKSLLEGTAEKFDPYCRAHFGLAHSQVNRLMNYARTRDNIGMGDRDVYISENALRCLANDPAELQQKIWEEAKKLAEGQELPTTENIKEARKRLVPEVMGEVKKQFHSRALDADVDLDTESPADVIRKAKNLAKARDAIREVIQRVELTPEEKEEICEFIKAKAEEEAMALMTPKSAEAKEEADVA